MIESLREELESTVTPLLKEVLDDARKLMRQEAQLIKTEARAEGDKTRRALIFISVGGAVAHAAVLLLAFMLAHLCAGPWFGIPLWAAYGVVALFSLALAALLVYRGLRNLKEARESSERTLQALREGFEWM
jgi:protein-S-isoprenylcysteine O-methyltransferase Ste14